MTPHQRKVLDFVLAKIDATGSSPTFTEISEEFDLARSGAFRVVEALIKAGHLRRTSDGSRNLARPLPGKIALGDIPPEQLLATFTTEQLLGEIQRRTESR